MAFYKFSLWHPINTSITELIICGQCRIWFFIFLTWLSNLNLILYLIHFHFPGACHGWLASNWKALSLLKHIHTTTIIFTLPSLVLLRTPPSSYPKPTPISSQFLDDWFPWFLSAPALHQSYPLGQQWPPQTLFSLLSHQKTFSIENYQSPTFHDMFHTKISWMVFCPLTLFSWASLLTAPPLPSLKCWNLSAFIPDFSFHFSLSLGDLIHSHDLQFLYAYGF